MLALPDYVIIDFFNWINANESSHLNIGYVRECVMRDKNTHRAMEDLTPYAKSFIAQNDLTIEPSELVESIRFYLTYRYADKKTTREVEKSLWEKPICECENPILDDEIGEDALLHMLVAFPSTLHNEIDFLEWLLKQELDADDISKMPIYVFKELAKEYSIEIKGKVDKDLVSALLHDFKRKPIKLFLKKIKRMIALNTFGRNAEQYSNIIELFCRYSDSRIMKCFFLPLAQDKTFKTFIKNSWTDLNSLSKNYLDIFYSVKELSASGYDIKDKIQSLTIAENALPCLVLWDDSLDKAKCVELRDLQYTEIFYLLQSIVQNIKNGVEHDLVCSKAIIMADEMRRRKMETPIIQQDYIISNSTIYNSQIGSFESTLTVEDEPEKNSK